MGMSNISGIKEIHNILKNYCKKRRNVEKQYKHNNIAKYNISYISNLGKKEIERHQKQRNATLKNIRALILDKYTIRNLLEIWENVFFTIIDRQ